MVLGYLTILVVGVVGNIIVLVVVLTNPHMQTTTNIYLVNLSLADILMCLGTVFRNMNIREEVFYCSVSVPLTPLSTFMGRWVLGETLCKLFPASQVRRVSVTVILDLPLLVHLRLHVHLPPHSHRSRQVSEAFLRLR